LRVAAAVLLGAGGVWMFGGSGADAPPFGAEEPAVPPASTPTTAPEEPTTRLDAAAVDGFSAPSEAEASVVPAIDLPPLAEVRVEADDPFLTRPDAGFGLCAADADLACTLVPAADHEVLGGRFGITLTLPRRFTTWTGDTHDCVSTGPCEVRLWSFDDFVIERALPVTFADGPAEPVSPLAAGPTDQLPGDAAVRLSGPADDDVIVLQCVAGQKNSCASAEMLLTAADAAVEGTVDVTRRIFTPRGPYDCATGACELRVVRSDARFTEPVELTFDASELLDLPTVLVRPAGGIDHGDLVELRTPDTERGTTSYSLCALDHLFCAQLGTVRVAEPLLVHVPRWIVDRSDPNTTVDCALDACVIRAATGGTLVDAPIAFSADGQPPPPADVVISRRSDDTVRPGDTISLAARGLFVATPGFATLSSVSIRFCESLDAPRSECVNTVGDGSDLRADGSFDTTVVIPDFDRRRSRVSATGVRAPFCADTCWLVVEPRIPVAGGAVPIDIEARTDADD